jgi:DNA transformation protein
MFGGVGIYSGELFFALIAGDTVYFKVDDSNRAMFEAEGMGPFEPYGPGGGSMQYYAVPEAVIEDPEVLEEWAAGALAVARQKKARRPRRK